MQYWASKGTSDIGGELSQRVDNYYQHIHKFGILSRWRRAYRSYYGLSLDGRNDTTAVGSAGDQGEYRILKVNHLRNVGLHLHSFVTLPNAQRWSARRSTQIESPKLKPY